MPLSASERQSGWVPGHRCDGNLRVSALREHLGNAILPYRSLPFLAAIGAQMSPNKALRLTRKLLMKANLPITLEKPGHQKINSPSRHRLVVRALPQTPPVPLTAVARSRMWQEPCLGV